MASHLAIFFWKAIPARVWARVCHIMQSYDSIHCVKSLSVFQQRQNFKFFCGNHVRFLLISIEVTNNGGHIGHMKYTKNQPALALTVIDGDLRRIDLSVSERLSVDNLRRPSNFSKLNSSLEKNKWKHMNDSPRKITTKMEKFLPCCYRQTKQTTVSLAKTSVSELATTPTHSLLLFFILLGSA